MLINSSWFIVIDILVIAFIGFTIVNGIRKGFVLQMIDLFSLIVAIVVAFLFAPTMGAAFSIVGLGSDAGLIDLLTNQLVNIGVWFVIIVIAVKLVLLLVRPIFKFVTKLPLVSSVNKILGGVFGLVISFMWVLVLTTFLLTPMISNGKDVVNGTILKPLDEITEVASTYFKNELAKSTFIQNWIIDLQKEDESVQADILDWLINNKFDISYE